MENTEAQRGWKREPQLNHSAVVAVIGTAGQTHDRRNKKLSRKCYLAMIEAVLDQIRAFGLDPTQCTLLSGGAAWAEHVAVDLYVQGLVRHLVLVLPCALAHPPQVGYVVSNSAYPLMDPGGISNHYHRLFSVQLDRNSAADLQCAREYGAEIDCSHAGFHARSAAIARRATHVIALTWSETATPAAGGTLHTWKSCRHLDARCKRHISLSSFDQQ